MLVLNDSLKVVGDADPKDLEDAIAWAKTHRRDLINLWNQYSGAKR